MMKMPCQDLANVKIYKCPVFKLFDLVEFDNRDKDDARLIRNC